MRDIHKFTNRDIIINERYVNSILPVMATDTINDGTITYEMNEHGYRSMSPNNKADMNVLTLGCSWTMGIGVKNEDVWASKIVDLISKKKNLNVNLWNYGMYGVSGSYITKLLYKILNNNITPDYILIMWPGFSRRDYFNEEGTFKKIGGFRLGTKNDVVWSNDIEDKLFIELRNDYQDIMEFWMNYKFIENLIKSKNINIFHSVSGYYYDVFKKNEDLIDNIIESDIFFKPSNCYKNDNKARDNEHPSSDWHNTFANEFFGFIKDKL
jgi:hypothetical protein